MTGKSFREKAKALVEHAKMSRPALRPTSEREADFSTHYKAGSLPVRNFTTNIFPEHERMNGQYLRTHFEHRNKPCWACKILHTKFMKVTEGPYKGQRGGGAGIRTDGRLGAGDQQYGPRGGA